MRYMNKLFTSVWLLSVGVCAWSGSSIMVTSQLSNNIKVKFSQQGQENEIYFGYRGEQTLIGLPSDGLLHIIIFEPRRTIRLDCKANSPTVQIGIVDHTKVGRHMMPVYGCLPN